MVFVYLDIGCCFLFCTVGVALMLTEVQVIKEVSNCQRVGGFDPVGQMVFDRCAHRR